MSNFKPCQFNWPFLSMYRLEADELIKDWSIVHKNIGRFQYPAGFVPDNDYYIFHRFECSIDIDRPSASVIMNWEPCGFQFLDDKCDSFLEIPKHPMAKTLLRALNRDKENWVTTRSLYVQWNVSFACTTDRKLRIDFFPSSIAISYWNEGLKVSPLPEYTLQYYCFINSGKEVFRSAHSFRRSCIERRKAGLGEAKPFYLSLVYPEYRIADMLERIVILKDSEFLHPDFYKWGRISPNDDPDFWRGGSDKKIRKIRT